MNENKIRQIIIWVQSHFYFSHVNLDFTPVILLLFLNLGWNFDNFFVASTKIFKFLEFLYFLLMFRILLLIQSLFFHFSSSSSISCVLPPHSADKTYTVQCPNSERCSNHPGDKVPNFAHVVYHCNSGYTREDGDTVVSSCFNGQWSVKNVKCSSKKIFVFRKLLWWSRCRSKLDLFAVKVKLSAFSTF